MQTTIYHSKRSKLRTDEYFNGKTGETLESELDYDGSAFTNKRTGNFTIESDDFVSFDTAAVEYLLREFNKPDVSRVLKMSTMAHNEFCVILQKNNRPHTSKTLYTALEMSHDEFYKLIKKLVKTNILAYCICAPAGFVRKVYMLNPYIARKKKVYNCEILDFFSDVTKVKTGKRDKVYS